MGALEFISSLIKSLAWPVVVLIIIFKFKDSIIKVVSGLSKFTYKDLQLDFNKELTQIEGAVGRAEEKGLLKPVEDGQKIDFAEKVRSVAEIAPAAAVVMVWSAVEEEIKNTVKRIGIPDSPLRSTVSSIELIAHNSDMDDWMYESLHRLRKLRYHSGNVHMNSSISFASAIEYSELAFKMIGLLKLLNKRR